MQVISFSLSSSRGLVVVVDSVYFPKESMDTAGLLYDLFSNRTLMASKLPVLIACNKQGVCVCVCVCACVCVCVWCGVCVVCVLCHVCVCVCGVCVVCVVCAVSRVTCVCVCVVCVVCVTCVSRVCVCV